MNQTKHLLLFTIGPVQSFIAQARKTRDLKAGSWLLSDLCKKAIDHLENKYSAKIIFPDTEKVESLPNRFLAEINSNSIENLGHDLEKVVRKEFEKTSVNIMLSKKILTSDLNGYNDQIQEFLEIFWVINEYNEKNYAEKYKEIDTYLNAIKNVRPFKQISEPAGRKCSLCGQRNALFFCSSHVDADKEIKTIRLKRNYFVLQSVNLKNKSKEISIVDIDEGEGLCAICFCKRFSKSGTFPSTAEVSLMKTLEILEKYDKKIIEDYENLFGKQFDHQLYFEENLHEEYFEKHDLNGNKLYKAQKQQKIIVQKAKNKNLKLSRYYALLVLDGDYMGKWLSGEFLANKKDLYEFHEQLSQKLGDYARYVSGFIHEPKGKVVYAGGDDVLAFMNLDYLFEILKSLRCNFPEFETIADVTGREKSSPSSGIVISHYKIPFSEVIKCVRNMEWKAKNVIGRNAFCFQLLKHAGEINECGYPWKINEVCTLDILSEILVLIQEKDLSKNITHFSTNFIHQLRLNFSRFMDSKGYLIAPEDIDMDFSAMLFNELKRLLHRSCIKFEKKASETKDEHGERKRQEIEKLTQRIMMLFEASKHNLENFLSTLDILAFINRVAKGGYNENK